MPDPMTLDETVNCLRLQAYYRTQADSAIHWLTTLKAQLDGLSLRINQATRLCANTDDIEVALDHLIVFVQDADAVKVGRDRLTEQVRKLREAAFILRHQNYDLDDLERIDALLKETEPSE